MAGRKNRTEGGSGAALVKFLDEAMQRGLVAPQTGADYIVACKDILPFVLGEDWTHTDIATLDMGKVRHRLSATKGNRQLSRFDEQFLPAVEEFRKHLGLAPLSGQVTIPTDSVPNPHPDPEKDADVLKHRADRRRRAPTPTPPPIPALTDPLPVPAPRRKTNGDAKRTSPRTLQGRVDRSASEKSPPSPDRPEVPIMTGFPIPPSFGVIPHLFPLRDGILATLLLPADLTVLEARRLTAFIDSLVLPDPPDRSVTVAYTDTNGSSARPEPLEEQLPPKPTMAGS